MSQQRRLCRSAGKLEGNQENGVLPKSAKRNVSRRECVSGLKAVFNFVRPGTPPSFQQSNVWVDFGPSPMVSLYFGKIAISKELLFQGQI